MCRLENWKVYLWLALYSCCTELLEKSEENKDGLIDILVFILEVNNLLENFLDWTQLERDPVVGVFGIKIQIFIDHCYGSV